MLADMKLGTTRKDEAMEAKAKSQLECLQPGEHIGDGILEQMDWYTTAKEASKGKLREQDGGQLIGVRWKLPGLNKGLRDFLEGFFRIKDSSERQVQP